MAHHKGSPRVDEKFLREEIDKTRKDLDSLKTQTVMVTGIKQYLESLLARQQKEGEDGS